MKNPQQARIVELQRQLKIARVALERIGHGHCRPHGPEGIALEALDNLRPLEPKQPLQHLVGHERRSN